MADDGLGIGVLVMRVLIMNTLFHQVTKTALAKPLGMAHRLVAAQLVHGDLQNQPGQFVFGQSR